MPFEGDRCSMMTSLTGKPAGCTHPLHITHSSRFSMLHCKTF